MTGSAAADRKAASRKWTPTAVRALGVRTDVPTAYEIITGRGRDEAYRAVKRDEFPVPVVRVGRRMVVPVQPILELLFLVTPAGGALPEAPPVTTLTPQRTEANHDSTRPGD